MSLSPRIALLLSIPPLTWAANAVIGRVAIASIAPLWLNTLRWALALLLILPLGWRAFGTAAARQAVRERWAHLALLSLTGVGMYNALQYLALQTSTPLNVTLIASSSPVWAMASGAVFYGVRPHPRQLAGAVLSLAGVAVVISRGDVAALARLRPVAGDLLMLGAVIGWSFYSWMLAKPPASMRGDRRPPWNWAEFLTVQIVPGLAWAALAAAVGEAVSPSPPWHWSASIVGALAFVAIGPSLVAYRLWGLGVAAAGPAVAAFMGNLTPLFAALLSGAMLGEWPHAYHGVAFALVVGGIVVSARPTATR